MPGDLGYANQRFGAAVSYLAIGDDPFRKRLERAFDECRFDITFENSSRPIPEELAIRMRSLWDRGPLSALDDHQATELAYELLEVADLVVVARETSAKEIMQSRYRRN